MLLTEQVAQRGAMVCSFRAGKTNIEIATFNNIPHGTVRNFWMTFNKFLEDGGKRRSSTSPTVRGNAAVMPRTTTL